MITYFLVKKFVVLKKVAILVTVFKLVIMNVELIQKYTTEASRFLVFDDTLIHYRDEGTGFPVLLLHGAFSSLHTYNAWVKELKSFFRLIRFDLPGLGLTGPNKRGNHETVMYKRCVATVLDRLGIEKCHIVGSSLGGWIAWEFAYSYPKRVEKMVLIGAAGFLNERNTPTPFKMAQTPFANRVARYVVRRSLVEQFIKQVYYDQNKVTEALVDRYYDLFSNEGNPEVFFAMANSKPIEETYKLKDVHTPTLLMWGKYDSWMPLENIYRFYRRLPNAVMLIYDRCGHLPMEELPHQSATDVCNFFSENTLQLPKKGAKKREE